ncbi:MAG TPA: quinone-dependent dihydroorotate dehydrogenase [Steroidobacteraceae bacterium]|nr:quinone-dependent dihydroorotate dehydrogenase [Steroidobacteraceae bacterium]
MAARGSAAAIVSRVALPMLLRLPPETSHALGLRGLQLLKSRWPVREPRGLDGRLGGVRFAHPVGLAAGFDKNGDYLDALGALGFSHIEVGTVTPRPQPGNPRPRLFRLRRERALINRMGFNNAGADHVAAALRRSSYRGVRGVSIGKNADTPLDQAAADYLVCLRKLYDVADYFAVNVSSPNTARLRELQEADALGGLVEPLQRECRALEARHGKRVPLLVKISPDLEAEALTELCAALRRHGVDGVIATNTSIDLPELRVELARRQGGGVSGAPLAARSLAVLRALRTALGPDFPIVSVGGLMSGADVVARLAAGADLVQLYTGFVYRGPALLDEALDALEGAAARTR